MGDFGKAIPLSAIIFLCCVLILLFILLSIFLYAHEVGCFAKLPRVLCFRKEEVEFLDTDDGDGIPKDYGSIKSLPTDDDKSEASSITIVEEIKNEQDMLPFGVDEDSDIEETPLDQCCFVRLRVRYDSVGMQLKLFILGTDKIVETLAPTFQLTIATMPTKFGTYRSKMLKGPDPPFSDQFVFKNVTIDHFRELGLRFRIYSCVRYKRDKVIYEGSTALETINIKDNKPIAVPLMPLIKKQNIAALFQDEDASDDGSDEDLALTGFATSLHEKSATSKVTDHPCLNITLAYNRSTGRLRVSIVKALFLQLPSPSPRKVKSPDSFVKLQLMGSDGKRISESKTTVRYNDSNPLFMEKFIFQQAFFQLAECTLLFSVCHKKSMTGKSLLGWFAMGKNRSGKEEEEHWKRMLEEKGEDVAGWHTLIPADRR